ncbi:MAG: hypothetical protein MJE63_21845 [Proteobacteria bacterium]|nr:hypothetical protein [Pseudomonadota bacterium]
MKSTKEQSLKRSSVPNIKVLVCFASLLLVFSSCVPRYVDPLTLDITDRDKQQSAFPPTSEELSASPYLLLSLITFKDPTVTEPRLSTVMKFVHRSFEKNANFSAIPMKKVDELLASDANRRFMASNVADAIQLGTTLGANFVSQVQISISESQIVESIDQFVANVNFTIFTTDSGQVIFKQDFAYDSQDPVGSEADLKKLVQQYFPLRAYILETRGDRQYAKISIGRSLGVKNGREFLVRQRTVKNEIVMGLSRRTVSYSPLALASVKVMEVMEDESWVFIAERDRDKVMKGQTVFAKPEGRSLF